VSFEQTARLALSVEEVRPHLPSLAAICDLPLLATNISTTEYDHIKPQTNSEPILTPLAAESDQ
jgi:hypothetical protein